jgi:hypothetical protein
MTRRHPVRGSTHALLCATVLLFTCCWLCPLLASAQDDQQDSTETMTWWVVGAGGVFDAVNSDGDTLSGTLGQTAIDSATVEDSSYGKIIYEPSTGWRYPRTITHLGFWLPKSESGTGRELSPTTTGTRSAFVLQNHPNPFRDRTTISYELPVGGHIRLRIYNAAGEQVRLLVDEVQSAGDHRIVWEGDGKKGEHLGSGAYFCTLELLSDAIMESTATVDHREIQLAK